MYICAYTDSICILRYQMGPQKMLSHPPLPLFPTFLNGKKGISILKHTKESTTHLIAPANS